MDFSNHVYFVIPLFGGYRLLISHMTFATWFVGLLLIAFAIVVRVKLKNFKEVPDSKFQNFVEVLVEMIDNFVRDTMGEKFAFVGNWFFGVIILIWCMNMTGLFGIRPPTANLATTAAFGISSFVLIHYLAIRTRRGHYFKEYLEPFPLFLPVNIIGEIAVPVSLSFRLFGNILGGTIIMGLMYGLFPTLLKIGIPGIFNIYFDIFAGSLQAFIFTMLSMTFIRNKLPE